MLDSYIHSRVLDKVRTVQKLTVKFTNERPGPLVKTPGNKELQCHRERKFSCQRRGKIGTSETQKRQGYSDKTEFLSLEKFPVWYEKKKSEIQH